MKCRIFYKPDGTVSILHPAPKARLQDETDKKFLNRVAKKAVAGTELEGLEFDDVEPDELPSRKDRDKWRGAKGGGIHVDESIVTKAEKRQALEDELDAELAKPEAEVNTAKAMKLQRKLDKRDY